MDPPVLDLRRTTFSPFRRLGRTKGGIRPGSHLLLLRLAPIGTRLAQAVIPICAGTALFESQHSTLNLRRLRPIAQNFPSGLNDRLREQTQLKHESEALRWVRQVHPRDFAYAPQSVSECVLVNVQ